MEAKIWNKNGWISETEPILLVAMFENILHNSGFNIISFQDHHFDPIGYSAIWLLSESHLAIHTFPEENKTYYELASCNLPYYNVFVDVLSGLIDEHQPIH